MTESIVRHRYPKPADMAAGAALPAFSTGVKQLQELLNGARGRRFTFDTIRLSLLALGKTTRRKTMMGEKTMRTVLGALAALFMLSAYAMAAEAEGHIKKVDRDKMIITLDDGKSYKLPGETDMDGIKEGMDIVLAYDKVDGQNLVTDMQTSE
jgi:Cu/Ag efflux protein CusF